MPAAGDFPLKFVANKDEVSTSSNGKYKTKKTETPSSSESRKPQIFKEMYTNLLLTLGGRNYWTTTS